MIGTTFEHSEIFQPAAEFKPFADIERQLSINVSNSVQDLLKYGQEAKQQFDETLIKTNIRRSNSDRLFRFNHRVPDFGNSPDRKQTIF